MNYLSFCSGIEAASVAWHRLGWNPVGFAEIEKFPSQVLAARFPTVPNFGDMTKFKEWNLNGKTVELLVGGTPCQSFSVAGLRRGLDDDRGNLSLVFCQAADYFDPEFVLWENVPGVLSDKGNAFGCFLAGLCGEDEALVPNGKWANAGVVSGPKRTIAWRVLDAQFFGVAQRRRRVFVVASRGGFLGSPAILFEFQGLRGAHQSPKKRSSGLPFPIDGGTLFRFKRTDSYVSDCVSSTLTARDYKDARDLVVSPEGRVRGLTSEEFEILQGFPVGHTAIEGATNGKRLKALGNSMAVPVMRWLGERIQMVIDSRKAHGKEVA